MAPEQFSNLFTEYDSYNPISYGYAEAIDKGLQFGLAFREAAVQQAVKTAEAEQDLSAAGRVLRSLGAAAQLWKAPEHSFPQKPSTLGQLLALSSAGALAGYGAGRVADWLIPGDDFTMSRVGAAAGAGLGAVPAVAGASLNASSGRPINSSFWDWEDRPAKTAEIINVSQFNQDIWNNPGLAERLPPQFQAAASGLVTGAANLPGKRPNSPFVTPMDIARMAVGLGSGAASGYLVGSALATAFGTSAKLRNTLINTGAAAGLIKNTLPLIFGESSASTSVASGLAQNALPLISGGLL